MVKNPAHLNEAFPRVFHPFHPHRAFDCLIVDVPYHPVDAPRYDLTPAYEIHICRVEILRVKFRFAPKTGAFAFLRIVPEFLTGRAGWLINFCPLYPANEFFTSSSALAPIALFSSSRHSLTNWTKRGICIKSRLFSSVQGIAFPLTSFKSHSTML